MATAKKQEIKVEPIKSLKDIRKITANLTGHPRNLALFVVGINTNFRASDLLKIKVGDVRDLKVGDHFASREQKTGKSRITTLNQSAYDVIQALLATEEMAKAANGEPLFQSRKGKTRVEIVKNDKVSRQPLDKELTVKSLHLLVKEWCGHLKGNYGSHTLRKTFGYIHRTELGTDIPTLMEMFNHATQKQTLAYLGIQPEEIKAAYLKCVK
jgi:integrase